MTPVNKRKKGAEINFAKFHNIIERDIKLLSFDGNTQTEEVLIYFYAVCGTIFICFSIPSDDHYGKLSVHTPVLWTDSVSHMVRYY